MMSMWVMHMFIVPVKFLSAQRSLLLGRDIQVCETCGGADRKYGDYYFKFDAMTREGERIHCLESHIHLAYPEGTDPRDRNQMHVGKS